ncbi:hypothetical protein P154DRAFT_431850 [Amniculicola lignicola CBS 123094]|uniref:Uncharacterized protein n=1 Tax=Amniculicola lignicola CBS 123094 TaxID=1392246 RepID=A0A6A5WJY9_9PLEO|nr:hypothetical protein P154DRAFT_431850 [Amniculicola lignicola CBS 123094]
MSNPPVAKSADKSVLFAHLGLKDQALHKLMLEEASVARDRLSRNPANLLPQSQDNPDVKAPYKWGDLSETAIHREVLYVASSGSIHTRPYYDMGRYYTGVNEENWVVRWYMWHSFRFRDNRDTRSSAGRGGASIRSYGGTCPENQQFEVAAEQSAQK